MCVFKKEKPDIPETIEAAPAAEKTARAPVIGRRRTAVNKSKSLRSTRRSGVQSLRIPSISNSSGSGNLNY